MLAAVHAAREIHPELQRPLSITGIERVLKREEIDVVRRAIRADAFVEGGLGSYVIVARAGLNPRKERRVLAHEYAHIRLHYQELNEVVYQHGHCDKSDAREIEAQLFARLLELGPTATPDHPEIAKYVAALDAPRFKRPAPAQAELPLPMGVPMYRSAAGPATDHGSFNPDAGRRPRQRYKGPRLRVGDSHDSLLFDWSKAGKPLGYFHLRLGWLDVWDTMPAPREGKREILTCGDRRAQWRDFVISTTDRRRYEFAQGEKRGRAPKELDKQIERAKRLAVASPISAAALFRARKEDA